MMPGEAYEHVARAIFSYMGDALMALLAEDAITAYNMYALFRLSDDITSIQTLADSLTLPNLRVSLWESTGVMAAKPISGSASGWQPEADVFPSCSLCSLVCIGMASPVVRRCWLPDGAQAVGEYLGDSRCCGRPADQH